MHQGSWRLTGRLAVVVYSGLTGNGTVRTASDLQRPAGKRVTWNTTARNARSEYALTLIEHGKPVTAIMDRSFVDASGIRWIIDYKTSTYEGGSWMPFWIANRNAIAGSWSAMRRCCASWINGRYG